MDFVIATIGHWWWKIKAQGDKNDFQKSHH
jgi:hypothetical protein